MTDDNNRIIQGGELELEEGSLDEVVTESPQTESATQTTSTANGFPEVDMSFLNKTLLDYLNNIFSEDSMIYGASILNGEDGSKAVENMGAELFHLTDLKYLQVEESSYQFAGLHGTLQLSQEITFQGFRKGLSGLFDSDTVDYFLEEFEELLGNSGDETRLINIKDYGIDRYLPAIGTLKQMEGSYRVAGQGGVGNYHLLLLTLPPEERQQIGLFFDEAQINKYGPFETTNRTYTISRDRDIENLTKEPTIIPVADLIRIGKKHQIRGLKQYIDRLAEFRDELTKI